MPLDQEVSGILDAVYLISAGLGDMAKAIGAVDEKTAKILAILAEEPSEPSPIEETLRNMVAALRAIEARLDRIEHAVVR